ncbi:MFS transporter [Pseudolabrys taiwanensis]|uniref:MFS transporter n=1 Tax=Pseudolabrys taiwanensis TaxID=331696 RepID=A0A345ZTS7_9HYPH|nr:MFS transporter [Pseudolabrys taiwanensis]AXK80324.1 MFS transporter [Pseudolabrys taiwanensis]
MSRKPIIAGPALVLAAGFLVLFIAGGSRFAVGLTLRPIVDDLGWDRSDIGLAVAVFQFVSAGATFVAGQLADRTGLRLVLGGGLVVCGIGIGLMSFMVAPWQALLLYGVIYALGNGAASMSPVGVMVTRAFPTRAGFANAVAMSGMSVGQLMTIAVLAAALTLMSWQSIYLWLGVAHIVLVPMLLLMIPRKQSAHAPSARSDGGLNILAAAKGRQFWLLLVIYAICGFDDFFVTTHVVAFSQDRGVDAFLAGNLLAVMGLTGLIGVVAGGAFSDRFGPVWPTAIAFAARIVVFALVMIDQSPLSIAIFALVFGATFLVTAPLTIVFVAESFGMRHLGALTGFITMVHQVFGGLGAYLGAALFDSTKSYDAAFLVMLAASAVALVLTLMLKRPAAHAGAAA